MKRTGPSTEPWGTTQVRGNEEKMYGGMAMADVRHERYEVNQRSERETMPNQVDRQSSRMECSRVSKAADQEGKGKRLDD